LSGLKAKIRTALENYDGIVIGGSDNFTYLTGVVLPFPTKYPDRSALIVGAIDGHENIICPYDWSDSVTQQGWKGGVHTYDENKNLPPHGVVKSLADVLSDLRLTDKKLAVDKSRIPSSLFETMKQKLPNVEWVPCDEMLKSLRIEKTKEEVDMLEVAAKHSESGIISALNHLEGTVDVPGYTVSEFSERVRVHVYEFGGSGVGYLATMQGAEGQTYYALPLQFEMLRRGELVRMDVTNHNRGYWSNAGRMAVIGEPTNDQAAAYEGNLTLKEAAVAALVPGRKSRDVFNAVVLASKKERVEFWEDVGVGHGVGVSDREPPYLYSNDDTVLKPGMVIALDIYTFGPRKELIHSIDTYEIVEHGSRLLSWYRKWDRLYAVTGVRSTH
jgi:Xaa-Pro dipeptidase